MRRFLAWTLLAIAAAGLVVLSGVIPLKASTGHWRATAWVLDFAKRRSVATHSIGVAVPPLDRPSMVMKGAGHYETGCRPCHGSPEEPTPPIPRRMTPHPPNLQEQVSRWEPEELFSIVKHGIKFTGMPAWPSAQRDDEVWAMVAFLRVLPTLNAEAYSTLVYGVAPLGANRPAAWTAGTVDPAALVSRERCARCHGDDGRGRDAAAFPRLAGQRRDYLEGALLAYARGTRHSGIMGPISAGLDAELVRGIADHYAGVAPRNIDSAERPNAVRGAEIASRGIPEQDVPACSECHGPVSGPRNPAYPTLAGQVPEYLVLQLRLFADGTRGGSPYTHIMRGIAPRLTRDQAEEVAAYYASLPQFEP